jgi:hypothetical protein
MTSRTRPRSSSREGQLFLGVRAGEFGECVEEAVEQREGLSCAVLGGDDEHSPSVGRVGPAVYVAGAF